MSSTDLAYLFLLLILLQIYHIFEEIAMEAYKLAGSLNKYLLVASVLVTLNVVALYLCSSRTCPRVTCLPLSAP